MLWQSCSLQRIFTPLGTPFATEPTYSKSLIRLANYSTRIPNWEICIQPDPESWAVPKFCRDLELLEGLRTGTAQSIFWPSAHEQSNNRKLQKLFNLQIYEKFEDVPKMDHSAIDTMNHWCICRKISMQCVQKKSSVWSGLYVWNVPDGFIQDVEAFHVQINNCYTQDFHVGVVLTFEGYTV